MARRGKGNLSPEELDELFSTVDETGHTNAEAAARERERRAQGDHAVDVDPLSEDDPSGSDIEKVINRAAMLFVAVALGAILLAQLSCSVVRRVRTESLAQHADVTNVMNALRMGVEWGDGFTQFPQDFTVQEVDENTGRIEVSVVNTSSADALECFSSSQIQATAFSINALLNPDINQVVYHVGVHVDGEGRFQRSSLFGILKPQGEVRNFMTFIWTKTTTEEGRVLFTCNITGMNETTTEDLRERVASPIIALPGPSVEEKADGDTITVPVSPRDR